jgi:hypothetical protein
MSFNINPCLAVQNRKVHDINNMNDICYNTCQAFENVYGKLPECDNMCKNMITEKKYSMGRNNCNLKQPTKPPFWYQTPHYFPELLKSTNNINTSYNQCLQKCRKNNNNVNECYLNCQTDKSAVKYVENYSMESRNIENIENIENRNEDNSMENRGNIDTMGNRENIDTMNDMEDINNMENYIEKYKKKHHHKEPDYKKYEKEHPVSFGIGYILVTVIMVVLIFMFFKILLTKE